MKNYFLKILFFTFLFSHFFCMEENLYGNSPQRTVNIAEQSPSWQTVLGGKALASPVETDYGIAVLNDGRMICAFSPDGTILWQKAVNGKPSGFLSSWNDFLYTVTDNSSIQLINPSGKTLWKINCPFKILYPVLAGRDGRFFAAGKENFACYGIEGKRKWNLSLPPLSSINPLAFEDGSILVFIEKLRDKKSIGLRISPFGEIIEEITFSGEILQADECNSGILILFTDSSIGLCSIENNIAVSKWIKKAGEKSNICAIISRDDKCALIAENKPDTEIYILNIENGELEKRFYINSFTPRELTLWQKTDRGFFITDRKKALEFDCEGTIFWEASLPQKNKWNYVTYTKNNSLVVCRNNWVIDSYKMIQDISVKKAKEQKKLKKYEDFYKNKKLKSSVFSKMTVNQLEEIEIILENGDYEKKEEEILFLLQQELDCYINDLLKNSNPHLRGMPSYYTLNPLYTEKLLLCASKTQTDNFTDEFSKLLELEQDYSAKNIILNCIKNIKYDRNGQILETFLKIIDRGSANRNLTWFLICDDTGIIAKFMGKPALYRQGKSILTQFMYPEYSREIRDYAGKTLAKMMELDF